MLLTITTVIAMISYIAATAIISKQLFFREANGAEGLKGLCIIFAVIALSAHGFHLYETTFTADGLNLGLTNSFSLFGWFIALLLVIATFTAPIHNLGIIIFPLAALAVLISKLTPFDIADATTLNKDLQLHVLISLMAYSILAIAALQSILLAIQDRHLRNKKLGGFMNALPPLETMETLLFRIIALGFIFHSMSLLTGLFFLEDMLAQHLAHKTAFSLIAWCVFATLLWGRWQFGWRGRLAIRWTISGFVAILLAYFGTKMALTILF